MDEEQKAVARAAMLAALRGSPEVDTVSAWFDPWKVVLEQYNRAMTFHELSELVTKLGAIAKSGATRRRKQRASIIASHMHDTPRPGHVPEQDQSGHPEQHMDEKSTEDRTEASKMHKLKRTGIARAVLGGVTTTRNTNAAPGTTGAKRHIPSRDSVSGAAEVAGRGQDSAGAEPGKTVTERRKLARDSNPGTAKVTVSNTKAAPGTDGAKRRMPSRDSVSGAAEVAGRGQDSAGAEPGKTVAEQRKLARDSNPGTTKVTVSNTKTAPSHDSSSGTAKVAKQGR
jgi:hypothetical protein